MAWLSPARKFSLAPPDGATELCVHAKLDIHEGVPMEKGTSQVEASESGAVPSWKRKLEHKRNTALSARRILSKGPRRQNPRFVRSKYSLVRIESYCYHF